MTDRTLKADDDNLMVLYIGEAGAGKSTAATTMARRGRVAYIDTEFGLRHRTLRRAGIPVENLEVYKPTSFEGAWAALDAIEADGGYVGIVVDSATELEFPIVAAAKAKFPGGKAADVYGYANTQQRELYRRLRNIGLHVAITARVRRDVDDAGVALNPKLSPSVSVDLRGLVDEVIYLETKDNPASPTGEDRLGIMRTVNQYRGKSRVLGLPVMVEPSMDRLLDVLDEKLDLDADPATLAMRARLAAS